MPPLSLCFPVPRHDWLCLVMSSPLSCSDQTVFHSGARRAWVKTYEITGQNKSFSTTVFLRIVWHVDKASMLPPHAL